MKAIVFIISLLISGLSFSKEQKKKVSRYDQITKILLKEERTIKSLGRLDTALRYRLLEIETERLKIIRLKENEKVVTTGKRSKDYNKKTKALARSIEKKGKKIIKMNPKFNRIPDIYLTLGMNARDLNQFKKSAWYLNKSLKLSKNRGDLLPKIHVALAEHYYNDKKYKRAIWHYQYITKNTADEWTSKHYYNFAWCLTLSNKKNEGIDALMTSYELSQDKRYINVTGQILEAAASFFVRAKRVNDGLEFYKKASPKESEYFIRLAKKVNSGINVTEANRVYLESIEFFKNAKLEKEVLNLELSLSSHYLDTKHYYEFQELTEVIAKTKRKLLTQEQRKSLMELITKRVGFLQVTISKDGVENYKEADLNSIIKLFDQLIVLDPMKAYSYNFLKGETFYGLAMYKKAIDKYIISLKQGNKVKADKKFKKKLYTSLLASINNQGFPKKTKNKYLIFTYNNYLKDFPKEKKSSVVYVDLFRIYLSKKHFNKANSVIVKYNKNLPANLKEQKGIYKNLLDKIIENKKTKLLTRHVKKIRAGFLSYDKKFRHKVTMSLAGLLFNEYDAFEKKGNYTKATAGYKSVYKNEQIPKILRGISAHNLSILYIKRDDIENSWEWHNNSLQFLTKKEILKRKDNFLSLTHELYSRRDYLKSELQAKWFLDTLTNAKVKEKEEIYQIYTYSSYNNNGIKNLKKDFQLATKYRISLTKRKEIINHIARTTLLFNKKDFLALKNVFGLYYANMLTPFYDDLATFYVQNDRHKSVKRIMPMVSSTKRAEIKQNYFEVKAVSNLKREIKKFELKAYKKKKFDEKAFNTWVESSLASLQSTIESIDKKLVKIRPEYLIEISKLYENHIEKESKKLLDFELVGLDKKDQNMVKGQLSDIRNGLLKGQKKKSIRILASIQQNKPLNYQNFNKSPLGDVVPFERFPYLSKHLAGGVDFSWKEVSK